MNDIFISHASEDKDDFVRPLALTLISKGWKVWYDEFSLNVGDSLRKSIDEGLKKSRFGVVVLSPSFFAKNWTEYELNSIVMKDLIQGSKSLLPIWHKVTVNEVAKYSLALVDTYALKSTMEMDLIIAKLGQVTGYPRTADHPFQNVNWVKEVCPNCGEMANHVGYEIDGYYETRHVDWIECHQCGYTGEKTYT